MSKWWQRIRDMDDAERARVLAIMAASAILLLVYGLGAGSLYVRRHYMAPQSAYPTRTAPPRMGGTSSATPVLAESPMPTATLVPTMTLRPG